MKPRLGKIGILFLATVLVLSGIAGAFAAWTDTISITGTVTTGNVDIEIKKVSGTDVYKDLDTDELVVVTWLKDADTGDLIHQYGEVPDNALHVAWAETKKTGDKELEIEFKNLFPIDEVAFVADAMFHYTGTVPAKIESIEVTLLDDPDGLLDDLVIQPFAYRWDPVTHEVGERVDICTQLHNCNWVWAGIQAYVPQETGMSLTATFSVTINLIQWNKSGCTPEVLYLSEENVNGEGKIFRVALDDLTGKANLTELVSLPEIPEPHIAHAVDQNIIYAINKDGKDLAIYDVDDDSLDVKDVTGLPGGMVLAAMAPNNAGELYVLSQNDNKIYRIDDYNNGPTAVEVATVDRNVQGADIAFTSDGTCYFWTNTGDRGLYKLDIETGITTLVKEHNMNLTGLAARYNGKGHIVGSKAQSQDIFVFHKCTGEILETFTMHLDGVPYNYTWGDMTIGQFAS